MLFTSNIFLFTFLPAILIVYYIVPRPLKNMALLLGSLAFYAWGEPMHVLLLLGFIAFYYGMGLAVAKNRRNRRLSGRITLFGAAAGFGILVFFKWKTLPLGLSFYTLQSVSYLTDVHRGKVKAQKNIIDLAVYIAMFPQMIAGPIVLYSDIENQLHDRRESWGKFGEGAMLFIKGLAKYVLLSGTVLYTFEAVTALKSSQVSVLSAWLGCTAYALYIYFAFGGYSDMAIGLGKMFGFEIRRNFAYPYAARSVTGFWSRWYISLARWFQEYVYLPIAGGRGGQAHIPAMLLTWLLIGLWHEASWNMAVFGLYFGIILVIEEALSGPMPKGILFFGHIYSPAMVFFGWVFFFSPGLGEAIEYIGLMFGAGGHGIVDKQGLYLLGTGAVMWMIMLLGATPALHKLHERVIYGGKNVRTGLNCMVYGVIFMLCIIYLAAGGYESFPYFRF